MANCGQPNCSCCKNELNLDKLCVDMINACSETVQNLVANDICSQSIEAKSLSVQDESANNICVSNSLQAKQLSADMSNVNSLCAQSATINNACINELTVGSINNCVKWRATVTFPSDFTYNLGSDVDWSMIIDDPNNNVSLSPFSYTVPVSGYYVLDFYLRSDSLSSTNTIAGIPLGLLTVTVNGNELRQGQSAYLSFSSSQHSNLCALVLVNAGDIIRMKYEILVIDPSSGIMSLPGTISIKGAGAAPGFSRFEIHYLSSLDCSPIVCQQCPMVQIPCGPQVIPCDPVSCSMK